MGKGDDEMMRNIKTSKSWMDRDGESNRSMLRGIIGKK